ncbi:MAG: alpha/beta hydrolase [Malacoplasma sp.]|nr:alpha/beta hydrolase [Malacoplasma sp.]
MFINLLGEKIYYSLEEDSNKPLVVFIHGLGGLAETGESFKKIENRKYRLLCFDLIGRGKSSYNKKISLDLWFKNIQLVLDELKIKKFYILAHSLGGYLSAKLLQDKRFDILDSLLITPYNPFVQENDQIRSRIANLYPKPINKNTSEIELKKVYQKIDHKLAELFLINNEDIYIKDRDVMIDFIDQNFYDKEMKEVYLKAKNFKLVAATNDEVVPLSSLEKLANLTNKELTILEGGHDVIVTSENKINELINKMIKN